MLETKMCSVDVTPMEYECLKRFLKAKNVVFYAGKKYCNVHVDIRLYPEEVEEVQDFIFSLDKLEREVINGTKNGKYDDLVW